MAPVPSRAPRQGGRGRAGARFARWSTSRTRPTTPCAAGSRSATIRWRRSRRCCMTSRSTRSSLSVAPHTIERWLHVDLAHRVEPPRPAGDDGEGRLAMRPGSHSGRLRGRRRAARRPSQGAGARGADRPRDRRRAPRPCARSPTTRRTCSCSTSGCPTPTGATSARRCARAAAQPGAVPDRARRGARPDQRVPRRRRRLPDEAVRAGRAGRAHPRAAAARGRPWRRSPRAAGVVLDPAGHAVSDRRRRAWR